jgi:hypothetical protein
LKQLRSLLHDRAVLGRWQLCRTRWEKACLAGRCRRRRLAVRTDLGIAPFFERTRAFRLGDDAIHHHAALVVHLDELDAHACRAIGTRAIFVACPHYAAHALDQLGLVLELELELQQRSDRHRLARFDEDSAARDILAVVLDELVDSRTLEADLERYRCALFFARVGHSGSSDLARVVHAKPTYPNGSF